jgi:hypothetical protein
VIRHDFDIGGGGKTTLRWTLGKQRSMGVNWIRLAQDRVQWRSFVSMVMNLRVPYRKQAILSQAE